MKIFEDTRNKKNKHYLKNEYFSQQNIQVERKKLEIGDYMLDGVNDISVDTKQDLLELAMDMFSDRTRFERELRKAKLMNIKLYILIEQRVPNRESLLHWQAKKDITGKRITQVTGKDIYKRMQEHSKYYGTYYRFCRKVDAGKYIVDILNQNSKKS